jgi:hypothetical protein
MSCIEPLRANISETLPVVIINEQGEEEKNKDEQEFSWSTGEAGRLDGALPHN